MNSGKKTGELFPELTPKPKPAHISISAVEAVFNAFNFGRRELLKAFPDLGERGVPVRHVSAHGKAEVTAKRREIARNLILYFDEFKPGVYPRNACRAVRNLALSKFHRGENNRKKAYYDLRFVMKSPDEMFAFCPADDYAFCRKLKAAAKKTGWGRMEKT